MSMFWTIWITACTAICIIGCIVLLRWCVKDKMGVEEGQPMGHEFDGIQELNNPLPKWWTYLFAVMIVVGVGYLIIYPGLGAWPGIQGWVSADKNVQTFDQTGSAKDGVINQYQREVADADAKYGEVFKQLAYQGNGQYRDIAEMATDVKVLETGKRLFLQNCAQCHGSDARGAKGFPNLADKDWLYGGDTATIKHSIMEGRVAAMPGWGALGEETVNNLTAYVLSLSGRKVDAIEAEKGKAAFMTCAGCHGQDGKGSLLTLNDHNVGAPNLTDNIWLYGGSRQNVHDSIMNGRAGVMPAWKDILGEDKVHIISAYVYSLSQQ